MSASPRTELVIVDDSMRFAFHVWRYLSRSIGIGGGGHGPGGPPQHDRQLETLFWKDERTTPVPLETADGRIAVWWVPGDLTVLDKLSALQSHLRSGPVWFLVDMRGQPTGAPADKKRGTGKTELGSSGQGLGRVVVEWITYNAPLAEIRVVSSYETGALFIPGRDPLRIWPKSPDTLEHLGRSLRVMAPAPPVTPKRCVHVLVTGAGFEIRDDSKGGFGLPTTTDFLMEMGAPFREEMLRLRKPEKGLPYFEEGKKKLTFFKEFQQVASEGNLDAWWDFLLEHELRDLVSDRLTAEDRIEQKMTASANERKMREAFRSVIRRYDWGHLNQCLEAARIRWEGWLTTNYTQFADRAIDLVQSDRDRNSQDAGPPEPTWRIVSTSIEALMLAREVLHLPSRLRPEEPEHRYLFKLHGDISHLYTMAAAGHDKELYSPLSMPVDSLHQVYTAAEGYLRHRLERCEPQTRLVWHIVGHGMQDWLLLRLIAEVCRNGHERPIDFLVVGPKLKVEDAKKNLEDFLKNKGYESLSQRVTSCATTADVYLSRVGNSKPLPQPEEDGWVPGWLQSLGLCEPEPGAGS
ncbi:MAG TPA: hypothetical protein VMW27_21665 [Thermoanaerobaculia bacterium]|nr:hypothetical protein [Thermoanaerobaculia bacterium]